MKHNLFSNKILLSDSYKVGHAPQYPPGTTRVYSYWESRGGAFDEVTPFGIQYILEQYMSTPITMADIDEAEEMFALHFGDATLFNREGWERILNVHDGYLPLRIKAVREGTPVPIRNVLITVENLDPECWWVTNYFETLLSQAWYPTTVATQSREIKKIIGGYLQKTGDPNGLLFKLHDFGFRGTSSVESAAIGGAAHLVNFRGTDTMIALKLLRVIYDCEMGGFSIPASEHSTMTSWGKDHEADAYRNMIKRFGQNPNGLYAVVSDSWNIFNACENIWGKELIEEVINSPSMLVIRPDSGEPAVVVLKILRILGEKFGYDTNEKGYKVLKHVRVIQGDGVDIVSIPLILSRMEQDGWSADNIAFGMGGALLQKLNRDTCKFAFKASEVTVNGQDRLVWKDPITDPGKSSKSGKQKLIYNDGYYKTFPKGYRTMRDNGEIFLPDQLRLVYDSGYLYNKMTLDEVRELSEVSPEEYIEV